jgi:hypothetical protein
MHLKKLVTSAFVILFCFTFFMNALAEDKKDQGTSSHIQVLYPPTDIVASRDCQSRISPFSVRATANGADLKGPVIVGGGLQDKDSPSAQIPAQEFLLLKKGGPDCGGYSEITADSSISDDLSHSPIYLRLKDDWLTAGNYTGTLWIAATADSGAQSVAVKVYVRPWSAWIWGILFIAMGAAASWYSVAYVVRQRQLAANEVLVSRLSSLLDGLVQTLDQTSSAGAPTPSATLAHIEQIRTVGLKQLLDDKELSVLAGVTVPATGTITVVDEIQSVSQIVQTGFSKLLSLWSTPPGNVSQDQLVAAFRSMDQLGGMPQSPTGLDQKIQAILTPVSGAVAHLIGQPAAALPSEGVVIERLVATTYLLDILSIATVVVLGAYILIWKNPGFGSIGNYIEAFLWGLGLKITGDVTKLAPNDVRTAYGIKIPSAGQ